MEYFPAPLEALVEQFARLPGIGGKTAQRLAFHVLSLPEEDAQAFADAIVTAKRTVRSSPRSQISAPRALRQSAVAAMSLEMPRQRIAVSFWLRAAQISSRWA